MLFHVLYAANLDHIGRMIEESVVNIAREYPSSLPDNNNNNKPATTTTAVGTDEGVAGALQLLRPKEGDSLHHLQIKFLVLLNEDETMRRNISNVARTSQVASLCPYKAERFYDALSDELIPMWIKNYHIHNGKFLDLVRASYLVS